MKKYFLTSVVLLAGFILPAFAEDAQTTDKIITGGANTCTVDVLGVYDNNATVKTIATWTPVTYECAPGQYLLETETSVECTPCPIGSYCPGGTYTVESETNGATACPTDYTSDAGAVGENECYMGCELVCSKNAECPQHSNKCAHSEFKTTGKQFSGETCNAYPSVCPVADFQCDTGYSKVELSAMDVVEKLALMSDGDGLQPYLLLYCDLEGNDGTPQSDTVGGFWENNVSDCDYLAPGQILLVPEDRSVLWMLAVTKNEYNGADIPGAIKSEDNERYMLRNADFNPGVTGDNIWIRFSNMFLPTPDTELVMRYMSGDLVPPQDATTLEKQLEWMSTLFSTDLINKIQKNPAILQDGSGMALMFVTYRDVSLPNTWVTEYENGLLGRILYLIPLADMVSGFNTEQEWVEAFFGGVRYCNNNTINIDWNPDNGGVHIQNMCYYDGAITLPADPVRPGYTFTGWKLLDGNTTE